MKFMRPREKCRVTHLVNCKARRSRAIGFDELRATIYSQFDPLYLSIKMFHQAVVVSVLVALLRSNAFQMSPRSRPSTRTMKMVVVDPDVPGQVAPTGNSRALPFSRENSRSFNIAYAFQDSLTLWASQLASARTHSKDGRSLS